MNEEINQLIADIKSTQDELYPRLKHIKVKVDASKNYDVFEAIQKLYGEDFNNGGFITFDMVLESLAVIKTAGESKADSIIGNM